ncbi:MAG TPA: hypothetical protein VNB49_08585 [Candidatus Dormibacteraeota bacterium]|nr:hypothetical protein [Candidatus Dormibacteraeota bacterium]
MTPAAAAGASRRAAAIQAAYTALVALYPAQKSIFDARRAVSLTAIASDPNETAAGIAWGTTAANGILSWRSIDGFTPAPPPFLGGTAVGQWRPTPPAFASGVGPQIRLHDTLGSQLTVAVSPGRPAGSYQCSLCHRFQ